MRRPFGASLGSHAPALTGAIVSLHSGGLSKEAAIRMAISTARDALAGIDGNLAPVDVRQA